MTLSVAEKGGHATLVRRPGHAVAEIAAGGLVAVLAAGVVSMHFRDRVTLAWLALMLAIYAARFWSARRADRSDAGQDDPAPGYRRLFPGLLLTGLGWGLAAAAAIWMRGVDPVAMVLLAASFALSVLVLGNYQGAREAVAPFTLGVVVPPIATGLAQPGSGAITAAVLATVAGAAALGASALLERFAHRAFAVERERDALRASAHVSGELIDRLELRVKTSQDCQLALKARLEQTQTDLELVRGKADALSSALQRVTPYDPETGLLNAKKFHDVVAREWSRMLRQEMPVTLVHMALDDFDGYRRCYGNAAYEATLRRVAEVIRRAGNRPGDIAGRLSNDGFALLFPEADHKDGARLAEAVRTHLRRLNIPNSGSPQHGIVTASFGVAIIIPTSELCLEQFSERAASALYEAQFHGGDEVVCFRTMSTIRIERWDRNQDGELTRDRLLAKLAILGYEATPKTHNAGARIGARRIVVEMVHAVLEGQLCVSLDGESRVLNPGDCLFLPKGTVTSMEAVGDRPVTCLEAVRAEGERRALEPQGVLDQSRRSTC